MNSKLLFIAVAATWAVAMPAAVDAQVIGKGAAPSPRVVKRLRVAGPAIEAMPLRVARVRADGSLAEPWRPIIGMDWPNDPWFMAFDCFEADPASANGTPYDGAYGVSYNEPGAGGNRYFFGPAYNNPFVAADMKATSGYAGGQASRTSFAWNWGGQTGETCIIIIQTWDRFADTEAGTAPDTSTGQFLSGFAFDFGTTLAPGVYFAGVNLTTPDKFLLPVDGQGAYTVVVANNVSPGPPPTVTLASLGQPMLWVTKPMNPSFQGPLQWDDDNPANGVHRTNPPGPVLDVELYDYTDLVPALPVPLGAMVAFYSHQQIVNPVSYQVGPGLDLGGGVASLLRDDGTNLRLKVNLAAEEEGHQIQLVLNTVAPIAAPTSVDFVLKDRVSISGVQRVVKLWNYTVNQWELVDLKNIGISTNNLTVVTAGDFSRFVQAGTRNMRVLVGYDLVTADKFFAWEALIDLAVVRVGHPSL